MSKQAKFKRGEWVEALIEGAWERAVIDDSFKNGSDFYWVDDVHGGKWALSPEKIRTLTWNYPDGADQYRTDVATLQAAGALGDKATRGEWKWGVKHGTRYGDVMTALESEDTDGECFDVIELGSLPHMWVLMSADADLIVNAARTARALNRFMTWALPQLGALEGDSDAQ